MQAGRKEGQHPSCQALARERFKMAAYCSDGQDSLGEVDQVDTCNFQRESCA